MMPSGTQSAIIAIHRAALAAVTMSVRRKPQRTPLSTIANEKNG